MGASQTEGTTQTEGATHTEAEATIKPREEATGGVEETEGAEAPTMGGTPEGLPPIQQGNVHQPQLQLGTRVQHPCRAGNALWAYPRLFTAHVVEEPS